MTALRAADIHARVDWPDVLVRLGLDPAFVRVKKSGPCPACGGNDRYTFDNRTGHGDFICRHCGAGDGFELLKRVHNWTFSEALRSVKQAAGIEAGHVEVPISPRPALAARNLEAAVPTSRVRTILRSACSPTDCADVVAYMTRRLLWPLPEDCCVRGHVGVDYFTEGQAIGRYAALVAPVTDIDGQLVTAHVTYLQGGRKLEGHEPRKIFGPTTGRTGCAVRLMPATETLGVAEGIETALSASRIDQIPVWATLNTSLLMKFEPPASVRTLRIYADRDAPGLLAACRLMEHLQGRIRLELRVPTAPHKDFNDQLVSAGSTRSTS
ncbi:MAG TPA: toprim domain-containing protein [Steroidobacteraceae bacterium]|jgi:putative DNA primase/helicase|nr:toprim domain-containing protein [Steroidobacteraceae bacterium]